MKFDFRHIRTGEHRNRTLPNGRKVIELPPPVSTICTVTLDNGDTCQGVANVHPLDVCIKEVGRRVALKHAIESLDRETRRKVWCSYWSTKGIQQ